MHIHWSYSDYHEPKECPTCSERADISDLVLKLVKQLYIDKDFNMLDLEGYIEELCDYFDLQREWKAYSNNPIQIQKV